MAETKPLHHIAIIPDGNRRWAKAHHLPSILGHQKGAEVTRKILKKLDAMGIHTITIWGFSTENWNRDEEEVAGLMKLFTQFIDELSKEIHQYEARVYQLGNRTRLSPELVKKIEKLEADTKHYTKHVLNIALDYGGRDEMLRAIKKGIEEGIEFSEEAFTKLLDTGDQPYPEPDFIIRTSGEQRLSGLMPWQAVYAEILFLEKYFPDLTEKDLEDAVENYYARQRRFGK